VLGFDAGNAIEIRETIAYLRGEAREPRLHEVTLALCAEMLVLGGLAADTAAARIKVQAALDSGAAAEKFAKMVAALGGPVDLMDKPDNYLAKASVILPVPASRAGFLQSVSTRDIGLAVVELGGGRRQASDSIDMSVGFSNFRHLGDQLAAGEPIAMVHAADQAAAERAVAVVQKACLLSDEAVAATPIVMGVVG
jgi:thymidine phosphorylase